MTTSLERRIERLEVEQHGASRMFVVEVDAAAPNISALAHQALHEAGEVAKDGDLVVSIKRFRAPVGLARLLSVHPKGGR